MNKQLTTTKEKNPTGTGPGDRLGFCWSCRVIITERNHFLVVAPPLSHLTKILQTSSCTLQQHLLHVPAAGALFSTLPVWIITRLA